MVTSSGDAVEFSRFSIFFGGKGHALSFEVVMALIDILDAFPFPWSCFTEFLVPAIHTIILSFSFPKLSSPSGF